MPKAKPSVMEVIKNYKELTYESSRLFCRACVKMAPLRVQLIEERLPNIPLPPEPVLTRWGTWLDAALYYADHYENFENVIFELPETANKAIKDCQTVLNQNELINNLSYMKANFSFVSTTIKSLEKQGMTLDSSIKMIDDFEKAIDNVPGATGQIQNMNKINLMEEPLIITIIKIKIFRIKLLDRIITVTKVILTDKVFQVTVRIIIPIKILILEISKIVNSGNNFYQNQRNFDNNISSNSQTSYGNNQLYHTNNTNSRNYASNSNRNPYSQQRSDNFNNFNDNNYNNNANSCNPNFNYAKNSRKRSSNNHQNFYNQNNYGQQNDSCNLSRNQNVSSHRNHNFNQYRFNQKNPKRQKLANAQLHNIETENNLLTIKLQALKEEKQTLLKNFEIERKLFDKIQEEHNKLKVKEIRMEELEEMNKLLKEKIVDLENF
ncbi:unnamed protein product [Ceutorhynchus assimilis]|uniref:Uncharacterized protein n=1 Tax=Ceutorhynchus assimilis TaxID=467358 RepID=A0A9N9N1Q5_9CUCU|nr:unnamed protein product [Ceutorhynchus assimilis]